MCCNFNWFGCLLRFCVPRNAEAIVLIIRVVVLGNIRVYRALYVSIAVSSVALLHCSVYIFVYRVSVAQSCCSGGGTIGGEVSTL